MFRSYYVDKNKRLLDNSINTWKLNNPDTVINNQVISELKGKLPLINQLDLKPRKYESVVTYYEWNQDTAELEPVEKDMETEINYYRDSYDYKKFFKQTGEFMKGSTKDIYGDFRVQQNSTLGDFYNDETLVQNQLDLFEQQTSSGVDELNKVDTPAKTDTPDTNTDNKGVAENGNKEN